MREERDLIEKEIIEDIYDIIFETRFAEEARKRFKKRWYTKNVSVRYDPGSPKNIMIGQKYQIRLVMRKLR